MASKDDGKEAKSLLENIKNFWKINSVQKIGAIVVLLTMSIVYYLAERYESSKPSEYTMTLRIQASLCPHRERAGDPEDGGWWLCGPQSVPPQCIVYSFGINDNFSFDHFLAKKGCQVHGFDPSPYGLRSKDAYEAVTNAFYHSFGLGFQDRKYGIDQVPFRWPGLGYLNEGNSAEWQLYTLPSIMKQLHHQKVDILKVDIEGGEWDTMQDILKVDWQELYLELHFPPADYLITKTEKGDLHIARTPYRTVPRGQPYHPVRNSPGRIDRINILKRISEVADMFLWENNNSCQSTFAAECVEIYFKRREGAKPSMFPPSPNRSQMLE